MITLVASISDKHGFEIVQIPTSIPRADAEMLAWNKNPLAAFWDYCTIINDSDTLNQLAIVRQRKANGEKVKLYVKKEDK